MSPENLFLNRALVLAFALIYWAGVGVQARRIGRRIGRSPNVRPRGLKETMLWLGWIFVVVSWLLVPFLSGGASGLPWFAIMPSLVHPAGLALGLFMMVAGYAGTLWCYLAMGNAWRMGVNRAEQIQLVTTGPYRFVRHPIYLCQVVMVAAIAVLLPSVFALIILVIHLACVLTKAADEDAFLRTIPSPAYQEYRARTGGWFPRFSRGRFPATGSQPTQKDSAGPAGRDSK
jgi:protein-S-isoprenylcysteine O-methyltransferase Ste14